MKLKKTVAESVREALDCSDLFKSEVFFTCPGVELRQIYSERSAIYGVLRTR
jgi:hypothetical protein